MKKDRNAFFSEASYFNQTKIALIKLVLLIIKNFYFKITCIIR